MPCERRKLWNSVTATIDEVTKGYTRSVTPLPAGSTAHILTYCQTFDLWAGHRKQLQIRSGWLVSSGGLVVWRDIMPVVDACSQEINPNLRRGGMVADPIKISRASVTRLHARKASPREGGRQAGSNGKTRQESF